MKSKILYNISRWIMALLFIFSGFTKAVNPFGLSVQLGEYFQAMGLSFLKPLAGLGGVVLPSLEMLLGVMLLMGIGRKVAALGVMLFMGFFTLLTLWIALANPVNDCGCFGDVIKISNWGTFIKNVILLPFAIVLFLNRNREGGSKNILFVVAIPVSFAVAVYCYFNLPLIDSTPYKIGVNVAQAMSVPDDAQKTEGRTTLIYKNIEDGSVREFEIEDTVWQDDTKWEYVDTKIEVMSEGYVPLIKSLPMVDRSGQDVASELLGTKGKLLIIVTNDFGKLDKQSVFSASKRIGGRSVILTSTPMSSVVPLQGIDIYNSDPTVISTIIQNRTGGALLLEDGVIVRKYVMRSLMKIN